MLLELMRRGLEKQLLTWLSRVINPKEIGRGKEEIYLGTIGGGEAVTLLLLFLIQGTEDGSANVPGESFRTPGPVNPGQLYAQVLASQAAVGRNFSQRSHGSRILGAGSQHSS